MADDAIVVMQATVLPDEIAKVISNTTTVAPADANDKWYYKLTSVTNTSGNLLLLENFIDYTASSSVTSTLDAADLVRFIYIENTDSTNDVYIALNGETVTTSLGQAIKIGAGQSVALQTPNCTVENLHAITSSGTITCKVAALIDDVA
jgi:hypothetical protein